jgi:hypothetical protein
LTFADETGIMLSLDSGPTLARNQVMWKCTLASWEFIHVYDWFHLVVQYCAKNVHRRGKGAPGLKKKDLGLIFSSSGLWVD